MIHVKHSRMRLGSVETSQTGVLADASETTGLPKDCFELRQISWEEVLPLLSPALVVELKIAFHKRLGCAGGLGILMRT